MGSDPAPTDVGEAIRVLRETFDRPDHLELYCSTYEDREFVTVTCQQPPSGTEESPVDRYRLTPTGLGETTTWTIDPVRHPSER